MILNKIRTITTKAKSPVVKPTMTKDTSKSAITRSQITINANKGRNLKLSLNSSPLFGLITMQVMSVLLYFGKRLPILAMIGKILKYYLGKTSFWSILVLSRKAFITFNAILGVLFVLKLTGLDITTVLANYSILGTTYLELLQGVIKNTFNWIFDLLDMKVIPNDKPGKPWYNPFSDGGSSGGNAKTAASDLLNIKSPLKLSDIKSGKPLDTLLGIKPGEFTDLSLRKTYAMLDFVHQISNHKV